MYTDRNNRIPYKYEDGQEINNCSDFHPTKLTKLCYTRRNFVHKTPKGAIWMWSPADQFILCWEINNKLYILFLYVDNILLFADKVEIQCIKAFMMKEFQWITVICD